MCSAVVQALKTFGPSSLRTFSASTMASPDSQPQETQVVYFVVKFQELFVVYEAWERCEWAVPFTRQYKRSGCVDMIPLQVLAGVRKPSWWHVTDTEAVCLL